MPTDVDSVLNELLILSENADGIIAEVDCGRDHVSQWFSTVKETANAIVKGANFKPFLGAERSSLSFTKGDLPNLLTLIKGKQNAQKPRVSTWMAQVQKDRVQHNHRKSRKSLRKIVLGKKSGNRWQISSRHSSIVKIEETSNAAPVSDVNDRLQSECQGPKENFASKNHNKSYCSDFDSSKIKQEIDTTTPVQKQVSSTVILSKASATPASKQVSSTPIQNLEILAPNTDEKTPVTRSKAKANKDAAIQVIKLKKKNVPQSSGNSRLTETSTSGTNIEKLSYYTKSSSIKPSGSTDNESEAYFTPDNKTIIIDSDCSTGGKSNHTTPETRLKRKSSAQHSQENAKKIKNVSSSEAPPGKRDRCKRKDNYPISTNKRTKVSKEINSVIPPKVSNDLSKQNQIQSDKRILREIQKKEEKVNQNAKKLRSLREMKIEENKKTRELKMEKAMQQRIKIEKEKEQRIRSRTQSKQENIQQKEPASKKVAQKKGESSSLKKDPSNNTDKCEPIQKVLSPIKHNSLKKNNKVNDPSPKEVIKNNTNLMNATYVHSPDAAPTVVSTSDKAPPKPIRKPATPVKVSNKTPPNESSVQNEKKYTKSSEHSKTDKPITSTPTLKKVDSKARTPLSNTAMKPNSYVMTPHESSFVSYDISQINSDDSDDEETANNKPIPSWAVGVQLRNALLTQHYNPVDTVELFGNVFKAPDLATIMGTQKKHYNKRTSSAVWINSPNRSILS